MKHYQATYEGQTISVMARHPHEAQFLASQKLGLKLQHLVKVRLTGETA